MSETAVAVGAAGVLGAVALVVATFTVSAVADMALAWRVLAAFMLVEGTNRRSENPSV